MAEADISELRLERGEKWWLIQLSIQSRSTRSL